MPLASVVFHLGQLQPELSLPLRPQAPWPSILEPDFTVIIFCCSLELFVSNVVIFAKSATKDPKDTVLINIPLKNLFILLKHIQQIVFKRQN
jgi:hypothetical protein